MVEITVLKNMHQQIMEAIKMDKQSRNEYMIFKKKILKGSFHVCFKIFQLIKLTAAIIHTRSWSRLTEVDKILSFGMLRHITYHSFLYFVALEQPKRNTLYKSCLYQKKEKEKEGKKLRFQIWSYTFMY